MEAGQEIVKLASGPEGMTVAEMDALLYLPGHPRQQLLRALRIPALSGGWKASFQEMLDQPGQAGGNAGLAEASPPPAWPGFRPLAVTGISRESETVISLHLADPGGGSEPAARPGQFLTLRLHPDPAGRPLLRSYSLSGPPGARDYRISVKREEHGAASQFLHTQVRAGDLLEAAAPRGTFTLRPGQAPVLLISAGVGATPVLAMLHALAAARSTRDIWWLHGARRRADEPFAAESRALLAALPSAHRHICYSDPGPDDIQGRDYDTAGRLSAPVLDALDLPRDADAYLCGPPAFMADISAALAAAGFEAARIRTEVFGAGPSLTPGIAPAAVRRPHPPAGQPGSGPLVAFARSDLNARWDPGYASLLEFAEACDVPVRWSCRTGVCHTCETTVISGAVSYSPAPVDDPADGSTLICCSQPRDDLVLDLLPPRQPPPCPAGRALPGAPIRRDTWRPCGNGSLVLRVVFRVQVFQADRPDRRHLGDVLTGFGPVEMRGAGGQDDDGTRRVRLQFCVVELLAQADVEHAGHDGVDPVLVVSVGHQLDPGRQLDPDHVRSGLRCIAHHDGETGRRRERRERLPVDVLGQDRPEDGLIW